MKRLQALNRLVVSVDAEGSSRRDAKGKLRLRDTVYRVVHAASAAIGVPSETVHLEDRGDGVLLAMDPAVPPQHMVGIWLEEVYQQLREEQHATDPASRVRLRIAMHMGPVTDDGRGLVGGTVDIACGLCDCPEARAVLTAAESSDLVFVASQLLYDTVIAEGGRFVEPEHYRSAAVRVKGKPQSAWLYVPRLPAPPFPVPRDSGPPPGPGPHPGPEPAGTAQGGAAQGAAAGPVRTAEDPPLSAPAAPLYHNKWNIHVDGVNQNIDGGSQTINVSWPEGKTGARDE
ncbi:hypothetical protein QCN29_03595 [Streptomyces sp. HNM0663]|uniref:Guanylate cyclase domain-containing protein n=1 Tax=Streptomyces chengmaiensis TaxID=3040919 RepID=A0ABT6HGJ7_9ACTN|nr:hypothetical protein [Streptomyces chengmaiensis]MDH2387885.1 hypothetical protein [Streptomyces chengmaiensis]